MDVCFALVRLSARVGESHRNGCCQVQPAAEQKRKKKVEVRGEPVTQRRKQLGGSHGNDPLQVPAQ